MSRRTLSAPLSEATYVVQTVASKLGILHWPANVVDATASLRQITTGTATIAHRLHQAAIKVMDLAEDGIYPQSAGEAASHLPGLLTRIGEHCRALDRQWDSVGALLADVLTTQAPRHLQPELADLAAAVEGMNAAVTASQARLWPGDAATAATRATELAAALGALAISIGTALANSGVHHPGVESARGWLSRISQRNQAIAVAWAGAAQSLAAIETARTTMPRTESGWPAIDL